MKLEWKDFNIGLIVNTPKGDGVLISVDKKNNNIGIHIIDGAFESFGIEQISLPIGSLSINLTQQIGQYILLFQRIENRLRDFLNFILQLKSIQKNTLTAVFTAGKLIDKVGSLVKNNSSEEIYTEWKKISPKLNNHNRIRNTIVHGYLFHYSNTYELDFSNIKIENANGNVELLGYEKLIDLNKQVIYLYYEIHNFFTNNCDNIKDKIGSS